MQKNDGRRLGNSLKAHREVISVSIPQQSEVTMDHSVNYVLYFVSGTKGGECLIRQVWHLLRFSHLIAGCLSLNCSDMDQLRQTMVTGPIMNSAKVPVQGRLLKSWGPLACLTSLSVLGHADLGNFSIVSQKVIAFLINKLLPVTTCCCAQSIIFTLFLCR